MNRYQITSAETKSIGFDYQYYYFLLNLLKLRAGQTVGLEVKDDVHIELPNGMLVLVQLKHSIQTNSNGSIQNLTERDFDLWKTLCNWINVIQDRVEGRNTSAKQLEFLKNTKFVLVSNKSHSNRNKFFTYLANLNGKTISIIDFKEYLKSLIVTTEDSLSNKPLLGYMQSLYDLSDKILVEFISKLEFNLDEDNLITKIKDEIRGHFIPKERIDDVYAYLNSSLRDNIYIDVKSNNKIVYTHEEFLNKYRNCFGRMGTLPIRKHDPIIPDNYTSQPFIKQLIDIGDVNINEKDQIISYTRLRLLMYNNMKDWLQNGELTGPQKENFDKICIRYWDNSFKALHRRNKININSGIRPEDLENDIIQAANDCLYELRKVVLKVENQDLDIEISNGQFYQLSDELIIGWHFNWQKKYKI
jgi:hypothetical protein